jgi:SNF2 family DNA or RNA helicase
MSVTGARPVFVDPKAVTAPRAMRSRDDLRSVQVRAIEELKSSTGLQLVMPMGAGKTTVTLTAIADLLAARTIRAAVVVAPVRVALTTWPNEIANWDHLKHLDAVVLSGTPERRLRLLNEPHDIYICSIDNIIWLIDALRKFPGDDPRWDMLVIDELSRFKSPRGERAKKLNRFSDRFRAIIGLTGTPRPNSWEDQYMPIQLVSAGTAWNTKGFDAWRQAHCRALDYQGFRWEVRDDALPYIRRVVDDWTLTIPPDQATDIPFNSGADFDVVVPLTKAQRDDLASLEKELIVELGGEGVNLLDDSDEFVAALSQATAATKMAQICQGFLYRDGQTVQTYGKAKLDALDDLLEGVDGENVMIAYNFRHDLEVLRGRFGQDVPTLGSDTSEDDATRWINDWNDGRIPVLLFHPASAGHGLNLQHGGRRMIWYSMTWSPEMFAQACKRLARPGQTQPVYIHRILADHWLERKRVARVERKIAEEAMFISALRRI